MVKRTKIRFVLGGKIHQLTKFDSTLTVLDYIREYKHRKGTKEGCAEGDCGACTIAIGRLKNGSLHYSSVNACIQFLATIDGCQLLTVEDLIAPNGDLHPIQQALVDTHGSQCGFCTPGFIMSMYVLWRSTPNPSQQEIEDALAGNLCRCTGYGPIIEAVKKVYIPHSPSDQDEKTLKLLTSIQPTKDLVINSDNSMYFSPSNINELSELVNSNPSATILAGGTDIGLWVTKQHKLLSKIIYTGNVKELCTINETKEAFEIGAAVRYSDLPASLNSAYPDFGRILRRLGSHQVRNLGTMGGNIANGSPIGDTPPLLIAMNARIILNKAGKRRELPIENYFIDYGKQNREPGEFLERIIIPKPLPGSRFAAYKISKRFDQDISSVCAAIQIQLNGNSIEEIRIAFGGMAATPKRALQTESALVGQPYTQQSIENAVKCLKKDFAPISDMRASAQYRLKVAGNLLHKMFEESRHDFSYTRILAN